MNAVANLVVFTWGDNDWQPLMPGSTPEWLKDADVMADLVEGAILERDGEFYKAQRLADSPILMPSGFVKSAQ